MKTVRRRVGLIWLAVIVAGVAAQRPIGPLQNAIPIPWNDSTAVVLLVHNYTDDSVQVYVAIGLRYTRIGITAARQSRMFVVPSSSLGGAQRFTVAIVSAEQPEPQTMAPIQRQPGKGDFVLLTVGKQEQPPPARPGTSL